MNESECAGCGSTPEEREKHDGRPGLRRCPHCGAEKCCVCDLGDDVECASCDDLLGDDE